MAGKNKMGRFTGLTPLLYVLMDDAGFKKRSSGILAGMPGRKPWPRTPHAAGNKINKPLNSLLVADAHGLLALHVAYSQGIDKKVDVDCGQGKCGIASAPARSLLRLLQDRPQQPAKALRHVVKDPLKMPVL